MANTPHTLQDEFPGEAARISALKTSDAHFARLLEEYDSVNDKVHRAEARIDAVSEEHEQGLRRQRSRLKDQIRSALSAA